MRIADLGPCACCGGGGSCGNLTTCTGWCTAEIPEFTVDFTAGIISDGTCADCDPDWNILYTFDESTAVTAFYGQVCAFQINLCDISSNCSCNTTIGSSFFRVDFKKFAFDGIYHVNASWRIRSGTGSPIVSTVYDWSVSLGTTQPVCSDIFPLELPYVSTGQSNGGVCAGGAVSNITLECL
jgi:hypothetical protein